MNKYGHATRIPPIRKDWKDNKASLTSRHLPSVGMLVDLGNAMFKEESSEPLGNLLSGYTYLGQFIDHDITFLSVTDIPPTGENGGATIFNQVTPTLDLSSVYGKGFHDPTVPRDSNEAILQLSPTLNSNLTLNYNKPDLPRGKSRKALIPDARNDENLLVAQMHTLFIRLHNIAAESLLKSGKNVEESYECARALCIFVYLRIVIEDFLFTLTTSELWNYYFGLNQTGNSPTPWLDSRTSSRIIPLEFSGAAFRFGHAMVRKFYPLQEGKRPVSLERLFTLTGNGRLGGFTHLPVEHTVNWFKFFENSMSVKKVVASDIRPRVHIEIPGKEWPGNILATRNLLRGKELNLPTPYSLRTEILNQIPANLHYLLPEIDPCKLKDPGLDYYDLIPNWSDLKRFTPLWYFTLREPGIHSGFRKLGPLTSIVILETFARIVNCTKDYYSSGYEDCSCPIRDQFDQINSMAMLYEYLEKNVKEKSNE